jgi:hypothetical protein
MANSKLANSRLSYKTTESNSEKNPANVGYMSFEVTSSTDHLKKRTKRGANCTSIDALIVAEDV